MPWLKKLFYISLLLAAIIGIFFAWQVWNNNRNTDAVPVTDIKHHFNRSVQWLQDSYPAIENTQNPILWWMIKQAAEASGDKRLHNIYTRYKQEHLDPQPNDLWTPMFNELYRPRVPERFLLPELADYQLFFLYSLSCDRDLANEPVIQKQLQADFCSMHYLHPRCITHQMMGLRFMQRYQCGFEKTVNNTIYELQQIIVDELTWDFRVTDAYIQRVLMLADSGAYDRIKRYGSEIFWTRRTMMAAGMTCTRFFPWAAGACLP